MTFVRLGWPFGAFWGTLYYICWSLSARKLLTLRVDGQVHSRQMVLMLHSWVVMEVARWPYKNTVPSISPQTFLTITLADHQVLAHPLPFW